MPSNLIAIHDYQDSTSHHQSQVPILKMSNAVSSANGTTVVSGPDVIQVSDFYVSAGILHPIVIGSIAVIFLFTYIRLGSNRSIAPLNIFDWVINVALGSTLAGIVNGNSLVRGLLALVTMLTFQYTTSYLTANFHQRLAWIFVSHPLLIVFRGKILTQVVAKHRISPQDVYAAMRQAKILNVSQVECAIIEPNGTITLFTTKELEDAKVEPVVLLAVPAYKKLAEAADARGETAEDREKKVGDEASREEGEVALDTC